MVYFDGTMGFEINGVKMGYVSRYSPRTGTDANESLLKEEYTAKVTGKMLYELLGSDLLQNNNGLYITIDGVETTETNARAALGAAWFDEGNMLRTNTETVGGTGNGTLTQVFVDTDTKVIRIAIINTYNIILDEYGYLIGLERNEDPDVYLFLTGIENGYSKLSKKNVEANAIFLDGTMKTILVDTTKSDISDWDDYRETRDSSNEDDSYVNLWCKYTVNNSGVYTLKVVSTSTSGAKVYQSNQDATTPVNINSKNIWLQGNGVRVYGNDDTVYINADLDQFQVADNGGNMSMVINDVIDATTGITNVDLEVKDQNTNTKWFRDPPTNTLEPDLYADNEIYTLYKDNGYIIAVVTLDAEDNNTSKDYVFVSSSDIRRREINADQTEYTTTLDTQTYSWTKKSMTAEEIAEDAKDASKLSGYTYVSSSTLPTFIPGGKGNLTVRYEEGVEDDYDGDIIVVIDDGHSGGYADPFQATIITYTGSVPNPDQIDKAIEKAIKDKFGKSTTVGPRDGGDMFMCNGGRLWVEDASSYPLTEGKEVDTARQCSHKCIEDKGKIYES